MNAPEPDDSFPGRLAFWRVTPRPDPQFRAAVWAKIEARQPASSWTNYVRAHAVVVAGVFAIAIVAGAMTGRERARARAAGESDRLANSYVQAMDARTMRMP